MRPTTPPGGMNHQKGANPIAAATDRDNRRRDQPAAATKRALRPGRARHRRDRRGSGSPTKDGSRARSGAIDPADSSAAWAASALIEVIAAVLAVMSGARCYSASSARSARPSSSSGSSSKTCALIGDRRPLFGALTSNDSDRARNGFTSPAESSIISAMRSRLDSVWHSRAIASPSRCSVAAAARASSSTAPPPRSPTAPHRSYPTFPSPPPTDAAPPATTADVPQFITAVFNDAQADWQRCSPAPAPPTPRRS